MINLLPQTEQRQLRAGRTNTLLIRYNFLLFGALVFLGLATGVVYVYLNNTKVTAEKLISENQAKVSSYAAVGNEAQQFKNNLAIAKQLLDHEVAYTKVILAIAKLIPSGVVLENLNLDSQTFGTETTLSAQAKDYNSALALKEAFQNSSLFSEVHFQSITASDIPGSSYPLQINLNVTIKKDVVK